MTRKDKREIKKWRKALVGMERAKRLAGRFFKWLEKRGSFDDVIRVK